jgi:diguanylate cyclase (GGDEF)-like protein
MPKSFSEQNGHGLDAEYLAELEQTHAEVIRQRKKLEAQEADLLNQLEELAAAKTAANQQVTDLHKEIELRDKQLEEVAKLRYRATHDSLTGIWSREAILDILKGELDRAGRKRTLAGILLADLDRFKTVNDTYGHLAGDAVLQEVSKRITSAVRFSDSVGRYGDDYFLVVLSGCDGEIDILMQAERIRWVMCLEPIRLPEGSISITVSIGATSTAHVRDEESVIRDADAALYRAKRAGGNRVEWT